MGFLEEAFIAIMNMSITASYVAIAVIIARLLLKKAPKMFSYALWSLVLFRLVFPFSFSTGFSLLGLIRPAKIGTPFTQYIPQDIGRMVTPTVDTGLDSVNAVFNASLPAATPFASVNPMQIWIVLGSVIWLIGVALLLIYAVISYLSLKKKIDLATLVSDNIYETDLIRSPFVCGLVRPKVYLPLSLTEDERKYILFHEQIHIRRHDYLAKPVAFLALALHWFNPLMWLSFSLMTKDMEMSCDERVMQKRVGDEKTSYSSSLLALATHKKMPSPSPLAFGESNVKARIKNVLNYKRPAFGIIIASVIVVIILAVALISNPLSSFNKEIVAGKDSRDVYDTESLLKNKTLYIGDNSKVVAIIDALPLPKGVARNAIELATSDTPYGVTINYNLEDDSALISEEQFLKNSVLLFALIDNVQEVTHLGHWQNQLLSSTPFRYTYTRADVERIVGGDVRQFAESRESLAELIKVIQGLGADNTKTAILSPDVSLRSLTEEEHQQVGTSGIDDPRKFSIPKPD